MVIKTCTYRKILTHNGYIIYYMYISCSFISKHYEELQPLFTLDPLLVFTVAYVCPRHDIIDLCDRIYIPYAIAVVNINASKSLAFDTGWEAEVKCMHNLLLKCHVYTRLLVHSVARCAHWSSVYSSRESDQS